MFFLFCACWGLKLSKLPHPLDCFACDPAKQVDGILVHASYAEYIIAREAQETAVGRGRGGFVLLDDPLKVYAMNENGGQRLPPAKQGSTELCLVPGQTPDAPGGGCYTASGAGTAVCFLTRGRGPAHLETSCRQWSGRKGIYILPLHASD